MMSILGRTPFHHSWRSHFHFQLNLSTQSQLYVRALPIPPEYNSNQKIKDEIELFGFEVILTRPINTETMSGKFSILEG